MRAWVADDIKRYALVGAGCLLGVALWAGSARYEQSLVALGALYALVAVGIYTPYILGGAVSLAYPAYLSIGGLGVGIVARDTGWPILVGIPLAMVVSVVLAVILGFVTQRLTGFHLAAVTLLFALAFLTWMQTSESITGGGLGLTILRDVHLGPFLLFGTNMLIASLVVVGVLAFAVDRLARSSFGIALQARRDVVPAATASGYSSRALDLTALGFGAAIASLAGSLFTISGGVVASGTFTVEMVFLALFMPLLGGRRTAWGAVLGAAIVIYLKFRVELLEGAGTFGFALLVLAMVVLAPEGLLGAVSELTGFVRNRLPGRRRDAMAEPASHAATRGPSEVSSSADEVRVGAQVESS